jgi:L-alanine-DL-glutamate epimerase-like enolase superfamily enzyme
VKVTSVEATPFSIPLAPGRESRLASSARPIDRFPGVLIRIRTDGGLEGVAEAPARPFIYGETQRSITDAVQSLIGPALIGIDPLDTERIRILLDPPVGPAGNLCAKGGIDLALHDLICQSLGVPAYKFLGGWLSPPTVELTWLIGIGPVEASVREASEMAQEGYRSFKIKVGSEVERDVETVREIRREVGDAALLYVDANEGYAPHDAIRAVNRMASSNLAWIEDPCPVRLPATVRRALATSLAVPVLGDNCCFTPADVLRELQDGTIGLVSIKTARTGFAKSRRIAALAEEFGAPWLVGTQGDSAIGTFYGAHFAAGVGTSSLPAELSYFKRMAGQVTMAEPEVAIGRLTLGLAAGSGVVIDSETFRQYEVA